MSLSLHCFLSFHLSANGWRFFWRYSCVASTHHCRPPLAPAHEDCCCCCRSCCRSCCCCCCCCCASVIHTSAHFWHVFTNVLRAVASFLHLPPPPQIPLDSACLFSRRSPPDCGAILSGAFWGSTWTYTTVDLWYFSFGGGTLSLLQPPLREHRQPVALPYFHFPGVVFFTAWLSLHQVSIGHGILCFLLPGAACIWLAIHPLLPLQCARRSFSTSMYAPWHTYPLFFVRCSRRK